MLLAVPAVSPAATSTAVIAAAAAFRYPSSPAALVVYRHPVPDQLPRCCRCSAWSQSNRPRFLEHAHPHAEPQLDDGATSMTMSPVVTLCGCDLLSVSTAMKTAAGHGRSETESFLLFREHLLARRG